MTSSLECRGQRGMRGVTVGGVRPGVRGRCMIVGDALPAWLFCWGSLQILPVGVFLSKGTFVPLIQRLVPEECWVAVGKEVKPAPGVDLVLVDGRVPRQVREVCDDGEIDMILSTKGLRASRKRSRCPKEWVSRRISVRHEDVGGLTTGEVTCWLHVVEGVSVSDDLAAMKKVPRDGMTVISSVERCQRRINVEKWPVPITPLRVVRVGPGSLAFHGGGLFPVDLGTESLVAAPCCFSEEVGA